MTPLLTVTISGSPSVPSRSAALIARAAESLGQRDASITAIELAALPATALLGREPHPELDAALAAATSADLLIVGTPVYRAAYTGLVKVFFDLFPREALAGRVAFAIATGASAEHRLVLEHALGPLFASVGATVAPGIYVTDSQLANGIDPTLGTRIARAADLAYDLARACRDARQATTHSSTLSPQPA